MHFDQFNTTNSQFKMSPGIRPGENPPFYKLGEYIFQELCRDLFDAEPDISTSEVYGKRGQSQDGIDLLARRKDRDGIEVGQCKCYKDFPARKICDASDEFFKYWERWSKENVKRFILFVASDLSNTKQQDEISIQEKRFAKYGIGYEARSASKIRNKLRPHPDIVSTYCKPAGYWIQEICGAMPIPPTSSSAVGTQASVVVLSNQLDHLTARVISDVERDLERMHVAWREGRDSDVADWLKYTKSDNVLWQSMSSKVKARILRFEALLTLELKGNVELAKQLAVDAQTLVPSDNQTRLQALIVYKEKGPEDAVKLLAGQMNIDNINLRASLLLEMGSADKCREELSKIDNSDVKPNAETFRIRALLYRVTKDISKAQLGIQKAQELEPRWKSIRFTAAVIDYFSALSPIAIPDSLVSWPEPVDWVFVKNDDTSQEHLRRASEIFQELVKETTTRREEQQMYKVWRLACLANDPERQDEANEYCQIILRAENTNSGAIAWAITRNFDIYLKPSEKALSTLACQKMATIPHILALVSCYLKSRRVKKAIKLLNDVRSIFQKCAANVLWIHWQTQLLILDRVPEKALPLIDGSEFASKLRTARILVLQALARKSGDWQPAIQYLEVCFEETKNPEFLFECCKLKAQLNDWPYIADRAKQLVTEIGTTEALRLTAIAAYNDKRYALCYQLLNDYGDFFKQKNLPGQLRRIKALCLFNLGFMPKAVIEAETLVEKEPTSENLLTLSNLYYTEGDSKRLTILARQLVNRSDLNKETLLDIAQKIFLDDLELAKSLWRKAISQGLPDTLVGWALSLGFQFGFDKELDSLMSKMQELGQRGKGGIQLKSFEELVLFAKQQHERRVKLDTFYRNGTIPSHVMAEQLNIPLVDLYHRYLEENETLLEAKRRSILLIRHGGHALINNFPDTVPKWRINLDVTAVLLAEHLGILTEVEKAFKPLRIPISLIPSLVQMRDKYAHPQPKRLEAYRLIIELVQQGLLKIEDCELPQEYENSKLIEELGSQWVVLFEKARISKGYLVDFLPLTKKDFSITPPSLPEDASHYLVNSWAIVEALQQQGPLSHKEYIDALKMLGSEGDKTISETIPEQGKTLYCHGNIPELLAEANLLRIICERYIVYIEKQEYEQIKAELYENERRCKILDWLGTLIDKLRQGIHNDTYEIIPVPSVKGTGSKNTDDKEPNFQCLLALLQFEAKEGDVIWVDDRYINSYFSRGSVPIIGINAVLKVLVSAGALKVDDYYEKLSKLRASDVRFIPVQKDEILYHLKQAKVENGKVIETNGLIILRRYVAECLLQGDMLQRPPLPEASPNKNGEVAFIIGLSRAINDALVEVWNTKENDEKNCLAHAEWLMDNLYIDHLGLLHVTSLPRNIQDDYYFIAVSFAGLISQAITLESGYYGKKPSARYRYFEWLFNRVLGKRFDIEPHLIPMVAETLKKLLTSLPDETSNDDAARIMVHVMQLFIGDIPKLIRDELLRDTNFMNSIGLKPLTKIVVHDLEFDQGDFFNAARQAINGRGATITPIGSNKETTFEPFKTKSGRNVFCFKHPETNEQRVIDGCDLDLLIDSPIEREAAIRQKQYLFDCSEETFEQIVPKIVSVENPLLRIDKARVWLDSSLVIYYEDLEHKLCEKKPLQLSDFLPPSVEGMIRHFRLSPNIKANLTFRETLDTSARILLQEIGLHKTIERLVGFPVPLPPSLIEAITKLSDEKKRTLIKELLKTLKSPLSKIHLIYIMLHCCNDMSAFPRLARWITMSLFNEQGKEECKTFLAILRWVNDEFCCKQDMRSLPLQIRLAMVWAHANRLFNIFLFLSTPISWLRNFFSRIEQRIPVEIFNRDRNYWFDVAHPNQTNRVVFLLSGLSYSINKKAMEFIDEKLRTIFNKAAFPYEDRNRLPIPALLRDPTQAQNSLESFLGGNHGEKLSILLGKDTANLFTQSELQSSTENAVDALVKEEDNFDAWMRLYAVLGGLPPYENLVDRIRTIIQKTDYVNLFKKNPDLARIAIHTASLQIINLRDNDIRCNLKNQLVDIAKYLAKQNTDKVDLSAISKEDLDKLRDISLILLESAFNVSTATQQNQNVIAEFVDLLTQLVEILNVMKPVIKPIVQRFCEELPISQAKQFWMLLLRLRIT